MHATTQFRMLAQYNRSANEAIYKTCAEVPDDVRRADCGVFFKSIHGTLNHMVWADQNWLARLNGQPPGHIPWGQELYADFEELRQVRVSMDGHIIEWVDGLTEEWLDEPFTFTSQVTELLLTRPAWFFVQHMFNHQTHHRGELTAYLMQLEYEPPRLDLPWVVDFDGVHHTSVIDPK